MRIIGIDPGLRNTGWGIIALEGSRLAWVADGVIRPDPAMDDAHRLAFIRRQLAAVLDEHQPESAAIEDIFVSRNAASALKLGMARGAAMIALDDFGLVIQPIAARRVKQNITGSGRADKAQVTAMVSRLLGVTPTGTDSADALAIAIAACNQAGLDGDQARGSGLEAAIARALEKEKA